MVAPAFMMSVNRPTKANALALITIPSLASPQIVKMQSISMSMEQAIQSPIPLERIYSPIMEEHPMAMVSH